MYTQETRWSLQDLAFISQPFFVDAGLRVGRPRLPRHCLKLMHGGRHEVEFALTDLCPSHHV